MQPTVEAGDGAVQVRWQRPGDDGGGIDRYTVRLSNGAVQSFGGDDLEGVFAGLGNGTPVTATVRAENVVGSSDDSTPSGAAVPTSAPRRPFTVGRPWADTEDSALVVNWQAAHANGTPVTGYTVVLQPGGRSLNVAEASGSTDGRRATRVEGLTNGTAYTTTVTARSAAGSSAPSSPSAPATPTDDDRTAPSVNLLPGFTAGRQYIGEARFPFTVSDDQDTAEQLIVTCSVDGGSGTACRSPLVVRGLTGGEHSIVISAKDRAGRVGAQHWSWKVVGAPQDVVLSVQTGTEGPPSDAERLSLDASGVHPAGGLDDTGSRFVPASATTSVREVAVSGGGSVIAYVERLHDPSGAVLSEVLRTRHIHLAPLTTVATVDGRSTRITGPAVSPDGTAAVWLQEVGGTATLTRSSLTAPAPQAVAPAGLYAEPSWVSDDLLLARRTTDDRLVTLRPTGGAATVVAGVPAGARDAEASPDGGRLAYWTEGGDELQRSHVWMSGLSRSGTALTATGTTRASSGNGRSTMPHFDRDGQRLFWRAPIPGSISTRVVSDSLVTDEPERETLLINVRDYAVGRIPVPRAPHRGLDQGRARDLAAADRDGDGRADVAVLRSTDSGDLGWIWRLSAGGSTTDLWGNATRGDVTVLGDFDGDRRNDATVYRPGAPSTWFIRGTASAPRTVQFGEASTHDIPVQGDFDGDRLADIGVYRPGTTSSTWYLQTSRRGLLVVPWGVGDLDDQPVPADYDGDGTTDLAVRRAQPDGTTHWLVRAANGTTTTIAWGDHADLAAVGDYDGDGRSDIAVVRALAHDTGGDYRWYVKGSTGRDLTLDWGNWHHSADYAVHGDFSGDERIDLGVWRPASPAASFLLRDSRDGRGTSTPWGDSKLGDLPVNVPLRR